MIGQVLGTSQFTVADIDCIGITDQRETTVVWDPTTGRPLAPAIVWQDTRGEEIVARLADRAGDRITEITGLPPATYFSAVKLLWLLESDEEVRRRRLGVACCSARSTRGSSGTSPGASTEGST